MDGEAGFGKHLARQRGQAHFLHDGIRVPGPGGRRDGVWRRGFLGATGEECEREAECESAGSVQIASEYWPDGRAGAPLPAARTHTQLGAHGMSRPARKSSVGTCPFVNLK